MGTGSNARGALRRDSRNSVGSVVILAAGQGKRMKSALPKVLHPLCGRPMLAWVVDQALALDPERILIVVGHGAPEVERALEAEGQRARTTLVRQEPQLGTGHALQCCAPQLGRKGAAGRVVVLYGDMPLLRSDSLAALVALHEERAAEGAALLTARTRDPHGFGRILRGENGDVRGIVEERDASAEERAIDEVNLGVYAFDGRQLLEALPLLSKANDQGEFYLTDVIGTLVETGRPVAALPIDDEQETIGVNTMVELAAARSELQARILELHMANGVYVEDPATTTIEHGVEIGAGTRILPCTVIRAGVRIGSGCEVGPFAQLRAGTVLENGAEIGNFTECKKSRIGAHAKAKHLAYLGDATIGAGTNIGAGTIFANYDGKAKHASVVGKNAFIGSGTVVVAPNRIGDRATTGAGAVVTKNANIPAGEVWIGIPARKLARAATPRRKRATKSTNRKKSAP
ncbi:MAG TPA: NTP transferase domain-containing protein [Planctomycetota bacterium]|nr:NTP transferase domain-containing protein [Planctomycetota bacterium]